MSKLQDSSHYYTTLNSITGVRDDTLVKQAIEATAANIISLLADNIQDDSLYLLFEWDPIKLELIASITDASKTRDAAPHICCDFPDIRSSFARLDPTEQLEQQVDLTECVKFWLHDYLATSTAFLKFSLVAIFHASTRESTELL